MGMRFFSVASLLLTALAVPAAAQSSLKLIPIPREVHEATAQSLSQGVQIACSSPCTPEDAFAVDDLKSYLASQGVTVNATSPVNILVTRYGSPISK
jgi:hypothetical protein